MRAVEDRAADERDARAGRSPGGRSTDRRRRPRRGRPRGGRGPRVRRCSRRRRSRARSCGSGYRRRRGAQCARRLGLVGTWRYPSDMAMRTLATMIAATATTPIAIAISMAVNLRLTTDSHEWHDRHTSSNYRQEARGMLQKIVGSRHPGHRSVRVRRHLRGVRHRPQRQRRADLRLPRRDRRPRPRRDEPRLHDQRHRRPLRSPPTPT